MNGVGKEFVSIQQFIFVDEDFFKLKKKKKNEKIRKTKLYIRIKNKQKKESVKRETLRTLLHVRDTRYIPCTNNTVRVTSVIITGSK